MKYIKKGNYMFNNNHNLKYKISNSEIFMIIVYNIVILFYKSIGMMGTTIIGTTFFCMFIKKIIIKII